MSKLITVQVDGDVEKFTASLTEREADYRQISQRARTAGAIHHRFGTDVADGFVLIVDEWETQEQFTAFFGDPALQQFIKEVGGNPDAVEVTVTDAVTSPDQF